MIKRALFLSVFGFGVCFSALYSQTILGAQAEQPAKKADPAEAGEGKELNRLSQQEKALLGSEKQSPQKTIAGLSAQVDVLQMQQDKLVEELLKYRRLAREAKRDEPEVPAFGEESPAEDGKASKREKEIQDELRKERDRGDKMEKEIAQLEERLKAAKENVTQATGMEEQLQEKEETIKDLHGQVAQATKLEEENISLKTEVEKSKHQIRELENSVQDQAQLVAGIPELRKQLQEAKNQLLMKQTEMRVLGKGSPAPQTVAASAPKPQVNDATKQKILDEVMERSGRIAGEETVKGKPSTNDVLIVEVRGLKVNLRAGPGNEHAPVMQISRGNRLTVEQREGDWYRVIAPTGSRAYIRADEVAPVRPDGASRTDPRATIAGEPSTAMTASALPVGPGKRPGKPAAIVVHDDSFEPFGNVQAGSPAASKPKDDVDRAFQKLKKIPPDPNAVPPEQE